MPSVAVGAGSAITPTRAGRDTNVYVASMTDFRPAEQMITQDWGRLAGWLAEQGMKLDAQPTPRQFSGGLANLNYLVSVDGREVVLRRPPAGPAAEGANDMAREWRVLTGLAGGYALAPAPIAYCEDATVLGVPFQVIEYRAGRPVGARLPDWIATLPNVGDRVTDETLRAMAGLHELDPESLGLGALGRPDGFLARQVEGWARRSTAAFEGREPATVAPILRALRADVPNPDRVSLLHCDFKPDNILFDTGSGGGLSPVAVIDWDMATLGDPLFDLGVLLSYWVQPGDPEPVLGLNQVPSLEPGFPSRAEVAERYLAMSDRPAVDLGFYLILGRFRLAIAWQQLFLRYRRGSLIDPRYEDFGSLAEAILEWTADTLGEPA